MVSSQKFHMYIYYVIAVSLCLLLIRINFLSFSLWDQVTLLQGTGLSSSDFYRHTHFLRYILVYPIFLLSNFTGINYDVVYSYASVFLIVFTTKNIIKMSSYTYFRTEKFHIFYNLIILFMMLVIATRMNGRILFAFAGFSFIVLNCIKWEFQLISSKKILIYLFIGLFLCSVSTGAFMVGVLFIITWYVFTDQREGRFKTAFIIAVFIASVSPLFVSYLLKNILFYGGGFNGIINMASHGVGILFFKFEGVLLLQIFLMGTVMGCIAIWSLYIFKNVRFLLLAIYVCCFGGIFGLSTLFIGIPILYALICYVIYSLTTTSKE